MGSLLDMGVINFDSKGVESGQGVRRGSDPASPGGFDPTPESEPMP
jgi:hypothetical protein